MRLKVLDHAAAVSFARARAQQEADADNLWLREHLKDFALGYLCGLLTVLLVCMLVHGLTR